MNRQPFGEDEWYHCFTRGVDKRRTFQNTSDYRRFMQILYLANSAESVHRSNLGKSHAAIFEKERGKPLVSIASYCIMPNHFHLILQEVNEGGVARFMQKVGTAYAMYFNIKYERIGNLFVKPFRSRHIDSEEYLRYVIQYVHLNAAELFESDWKSGQIGNIKNLERRIKEYEYTSAGDYYSKKVRPERSILSSEAMELVLEDFPPLRSIMDDAAEYYRTLTL